MDRLTAHYERQEDLLWRAFVEESPDIHAAGRSLSAAQEQLRSALADHGRADSEVIDLVDLPAGPRHAVDAATEARQAAAESAARSAELTAQAAKALATEGFSLRDVAAVLGLSHTRVQQVLRNDSNRGRTATAQVVRRTTL